MVIGRTGRRYQQPERERPPSPAFLFFLLLLLLLLRYLPATGASSSSSSFSPSCRHPRADRKPFAHLGGDCADRRPCDLRAKPCTQLECDAGKRGGHSGLFLSAASPDPPVKQQRRRRGGREQAEAEGAAAAAANPCERFELLYRFLFLVWSPLGFLLPGRTPGFQIPPDCCGAGRCFSPTEAIGDRRPSPGSSEWLCPSPPTEANAAARSYQRRVSFNQNEAFS
ncbi:uncharacterized protein LOC131195042 [Ahaetulla prasina]|uniref:uncharacterized protein LOC131195042 n=1 Tax=Ahaetulla prasina TaxID=499056 RepID=UPI00264829C1|nr:uncharacterized protein LOC131195042 [Ahaetulla prasina]